VWPPACTFLMSNHPRNNKFRRLRKHWAMTQAELGYLLGKRQEAISKYELQLTSPSTDVLIGAEVIFGAPVRDMFPHAYGAIEDEISLRARALLKELECRSDIPAAVKLDLLMQLIGRASHNKFRL